jgi:hypothetical protein
MPRPRRVLEVFSELEDGLVSIDTEHLEGLSVHLHIEARPATWYWIGA